MIQADTTDEDGICDADALSITVNNVAPVVEAGADQTVEEGSEVVFDGSYSDNGTADAHTISWDFGDSYTKTGTLTPAHTMQTMDHTLLL